MDNPNPDLQPFARLMLNYPPRSSATVGYDELHDGSGARRPHWRYLLDALENIGVAELRSRQQEARRLMRDNGIVYNPYDAPTDELRDWQLDLIPMALSSAEWRGLERGLRQRAELLRLLLTDLYGPRRLLGSVLPPELVLSHPGFLYPCHELPTPTGNPLLQYAADLVRGPDGGFWVVDDRTQAPPGAGFALENRMVLSRVLPSLFRDAQVHRLAQYFRTLRQTLMRLGAALRRGDDARIVLLTPGPSSDTYFEQVYLAKYLGYTLIEGADLTVRESRVWLKTLDGLQRVDVILRFVGDHLCDPLELRHDSSYGVAGLLAAIRAGNVAVVNPPGAGLAENPALMGYLPALARHLLGEELLLPSPPSFWCGDPKARRHVLSNLDTLLVRRLSPTVAGAGGDLHGALLEPARREQLAASIAAEPRLYVAREEIVASSAPALNDDRLEPRPLVLRSFLVATENDYLAMPGGLSRVAPGPGDDRLVGPVQDGGLSKDTWVLASEPIRPLSLLHAADRASAAAGYAIRQGELPSRVAENLFWLGRYSERSESVIRLLRAVFLYLLEPDEDYVGHSSSACLHALLRSVTELTRTYPGFVGKGGSRRLNRPDAELLAVFLDDGRSGSLAYTLRSLLYTANSIRDRLSPDLWRVISDIDDGLKLLRQPRSRLHFSTDADNEMLNSALLELNRLLTAFVALTGLAIDSMTHGQGWRFLMIGRRLERGQQLTSLLSATLVESNDDETMLLEYLLRTCDSLMTYRSRYRSQIELPSVLELLLLDEQNPRALGYQLRQLHDDVCSLPAPGDTLPYRRAEQALALEALTQVRLSPVDELPALDERGRRRRTLAALLRTLSERLGALSDALSASYFSHANKPQLL